MNVFNMLTHTFEFLILDFDFKLTHEEINKDYMGRYLVVYRNDKSNVQLEFSADENWFHCVLRKLINGAAVKYSDKENSVGFENLAILESNNNYDHFDYVVVSKGLAKVLENTKNLLKRNRTILTGESWIDMGRIKQLRDEELVREYNIPLSSLERKPMYFDELKKLANDFLRHRGFSLSFDSNEEPPYSNKARTNKIIFNKQNISITIGHEDWRDFDFVYYIAINNSRVFEIDLSESNNNTPYQLERTMTLLKKLTDQYA